jgi:hypothetical protein
MSEIHPFSDHPHGGLVALVLLCSFGVFAIIFCGTILLSIFSDDFLLILLASACFFGIGVLTHFALRDCGLHSRQILWIVVISAMIAVVAGAWLYANLAQGYAHFETVREELNLAYPDNPRLESLNVFFDMIHPPLNFPTFAFLGVALYSLVPLLFDWKDLRAKNPKMHRS